MVELTSIFLVAIIMVNKAIGEISVSEPISNGVVHPHMDNQPVGQPVEVYGLRLLNLVGQVFLSKKKKNEYAGGSYS